MEYEYALSTASNSILQCAKANQVVQGIGGQAVTNRVEVKNGQCYPNQGCFRHSRGSGALHSDLQNEEEGTAVDEGADL